MHAVNRQLKVDANELRKAAGHWLRERRVELGISQRTLAERVNMEYYTFISQIEAGRGRVPSEKLQQWAKDFEIRLESFREASWKDLF